MNKAQYDAYRQGVYGAAASMVDQHDAYRANNQLDANAQTFFIAEMEALLADFKKQTDASRKPNGPIEASWLDPRFKDYYDFFSTILAGWRRDLDGMPIIPPDPKPGPVVIPNGQPGGLTPSQTDKNILVPPPIKVNIPGFPPTPPPLNTNPASVPVFSSTPRPASSLPENWPVWALGGLALLYFMRK